MSEFTSMQYEVTDRAIVHMDLDSFFVSVECLQNPDLLGKPVLIGGKSDRGVVSSCSYEARAFGVHSAMPIKKARALCPEAIVLSGSVGLYSKYSHIVTDIIKDSVPLYEKSSIDEFYIDLTGMDRYFGCLQFATELRQKIMRESGLPISFGLATSKTVAKIATGEAKPNNQLEVPKGEEIAFLAPLSVQKIPMAGKQTVQKLHKMGIRHIKDLQETPKALLERSLGKAGIILWRKARGIDNSPVKPYRERKSISMERTFEHDINDRDKLKSLFIAMTENLCFQLRKKNKLTACVAVKVRYSDFETHTIQAHVPYTSADHILIEQVLELFDRLYDQKQLLRLVGVRMSHLVGGGHQINLFEDSAGLINLYQAMDEVRDRFGDRAVGRAAGKEVKRIGRFNPFKGESSE